MSLLAACGGGEAVEGPAPGLSLGDSLLGPVPLRGLPGLPDTATLPSRSPAGPTLLHLREGDAYTPALSPSGDRIAWGELVTGAEAGPAGEPATEDPPTPAGDTATEAEPTPAGDTATEGEPTPADPVGEERIPLTRILVRPVEGGSAATDTLLDLETSRRWAAYGTFLVSLRWDGPDRVRAVLSDGDVGLSELLLPVPPGEIVSRTSDDGDPATELPPEDRRLLERLRGAFPDIPRRVLESSFGGLLVRRAGTGVLLQKNYVDTDRHVWYLDPVRGVREVVVELPDSLLGNLRGGVSAGETTVFLVVLGGMGHVLVHRPGLVRLADSFRLEDGAGRLVEVGRREGDVLFTVRTHPRGRPGTDRLYLLTEGSLSRVVAPGGLEGVDVSAGWSRIAFSYWSGGDRDIRVAPLRLP